MKKLITILLALTMLCGLAACGGEKQTNSEPTPPAATPPTESESHPSPEMPSETPEPVSSPEAEGKGKVLVAYFSATGNTRPLAEYIAEAQDAELYEIIPETPYTDADLDWHDSASRTTLEMNNPDSRPVISGSVENMDDYDIVFLGYPIRWGGAPHIIRTFLESYDFSGKTIVPFCTSGSSGIGSSATDLHDLAPDATWLDGSRFSAGTSRDTITEWVNSLELDIQA